jgi:hypothetical protein
MATGIKIVKALYGVSPNNVDVTASVVSHVKDGSINLVVTPDSLGVTDPNPGKQKTLDVTYTINNGPSNTQSVKDNEVFMVNAPPERKATGLEITKAEYGYPGNFTNVTNAVQNYVKDGIINLKVAFNNLGIPDPNPNKQKELKINYTLNGAENTQVLKDGQTFNISAPIGSAVSNSQPTDNAYSFFGSLFGALVKGVFMFLYVVSIFTIGDFFAPVITSQDPNGLVLTFVDSKRKLYLILGAITPFSAFWGLPIYLYFRRLWTGNDLNI